MLYGLISGVAALGLAGSLAIGGMCNPEIMNDPAMGRMMESPMPTMQGMGGMMGSMEMPLPRMGAQAPQALPAEATQVATISVEGMTCGGCAIGVRTALNRLDGVAKADVSYQEQRAIVTFDPEKVSTDRLLQAIGEFGYTTNLISVEEKT